MESRHPEGRQKPINNIDGFIPNRKGRTIGDPFKKSINTSARLSSVNKTLGVPVQAAAGSQNSVTWSPRLQDPADVPLKRKSDRKNSIKKHQKFRKNLKITAITLGSLIVIIGGFLGFKFFHNIDKVFGGNVISNLSSLFGTANLKNQDGRVNILLAGDSTDDPGHQGAALTDSIMVVSINTKNNTGFLLSIPRDLWVNVPTLGWNKINSANEVTSFSQPGYPNGGMGQLEEIVHQNLGIPIDYYALINYTAFRDSVNAVGGITVNIQSSDPRGLFDPNISKADGGPLRLPNGEDFLNGQTALNLARARGDPCYCGQYAYGFPNSDFDRTQNQRLELIALAQKATSVGVLSNPVRLGQLFDSLGNNVTTDLNLSDVVTLAKLSKSANLAKAQSLTYSNSGTNPLLVSYESDGQDSLIPKAGLGDYSQLQLYYQKLTSNNPVVQESASAVILNGSNTTGLAKQWQTYLISQGVNVTSIADASTSYAESEIVDNSSGKDPSTKQLLTQNFGSNYIANSTALNPSGANFVIIVGNNQSAPPSS